MTPTHEQTLGGEIALSGTVKFSFVMRDDWIAAGFVQAARRFIEVEERGGRDPNAVGRDLSIALFEACNWLTILDKRNGLGASPDLQAMRFIRDRTQHQYASAIHRDPDSGEWRWQLVDFLPFPDEHQHKKERFIPAYVSAFEGKPIRDALQRLSAFVERRYPLAAAS